VPAGESGCTRSDCGDYGGFAVLILGGSSSIDWASVSST
jgi:hypothetical protein